MTTIPRIFAVIPAAGHSRRMGRPKLLLPLGGVPVIVRLLHTLSAAGVTHTVVVLRQDDEPLRELVTSCGAIAVQPDTPPPDMRESITCGLRYIREQFQPGSSDAWLLSPADHPLLDAAILRLLISEWNTGKHRILIPVHEGRRGHPAFLRWELAAEVETIPPHLGLNHLIREHAADVSEIPCNSPAIITDLDTPADYERLSALYNP